MSCPDLDPELARMIDVDADLAISILRSLKRQLEPDYTTSLESLEDLTGTILRAVNRIKGRLDTLEHHDWSKPDA